MAHKYIPKLLSEEIQTGLPRKEDCIYTPHYCEENIWLLVKKIEEYSPDKLKFCFTVFISNEIKCVPLWQQSVSKEKDGFVAWDYHVIMVYCDSERSVVFDFDTLLPFPTLFSSYCEETLKSDELFQPQYHRLFRVVPADLYVKHFSSDRRHMRREDGEWLKPPPNYPSIQNDVDIHNLSQYISMREDSVHCGKFGNILNLNSFIAMFSNNSSQINYVYPPELLQQNSLS